jgi:gamma-glutamyl hercynylcysteine S-oxide synthase
LFDLALAGETMTSLDFTLELSHKGLATSDGASIPLMRESPGTRGIAARSFGKADIERELIRMRTWLIDWAESLPEAALQPPIISTINPPLWEACHVAWFAEWWCVRDANNVENGSPLGVSKADRDSMWADCDEFLNSNVISHQARWSLPQITRVATIDFLQRSLDATITRLRASDEDAESLYRFRLAMFHEAMHLEALAWCAQTLAWATPPWIGRTQPQSAANFAMSSIHNRPNETGDKEFLFEFQFDNEIGYAPISTVRLAIEPILVSNRDFTSFVESGDYQKLIGREHPIYWRRDVSGDWQQRRFDQWIPLDLDEPVIHVNAFEADAFAKWADGRLPTEDELHIHFNGDSATDSWHGHVWEWTASAFAPPPNFKPGLYREYSAPWFDGKHRVLRGGSFATLDIMHHPKYRNFFTPERADVFAGFRLCKK